VAASVVDLLLKPGQEKATSLALQAKLDSINHKLDNA
jgi:hypothetical protein